MDPLIEKYREIYPQDLAEQVGLDGEVLQPAFKTNVLLNPMFGLNNRIDGDGLLMQMQYDIGRSSKFTNVFFYLSTHYH